MTCTVEFFFERPIHAILVCLLARLRPPRYTLSSAAPVPVPPIPQATIPRLQRAAQSPIAVALPFGGRDAVREVLGPLVAGEPRAPLLAPLTDRALPCLIASSWRADRCAAAVVSSTGARGTRVWPSRAPRQRLRQASEVYSPVRSGQPLCR